MKVSLPSRPYKVYAFVSTQCELEREPSWLIGVDNAEPAKRRISLFRTVYAGIYGFSDVDNRDKFVRQLNNTGHGEIAHVCSLLKGE